MTVAVIWIAVGQKRMSKINVNLGLMSTNVLSSMSICAFTKISFINFFPSLAILSKNDKTKIFKLTPNIPP